ncbi:hypothetical protein [Bacillus sp. AFS031507]|uniref:hypothetical protein n=1 Tax=Bacillus sp. AFS031507 TaxID=2033496 RepID=UPI000BFE753F|nr:hypothetical protein [Bacillus sp. AFS031507]PGY09109.1 hypothetical protein COE25_18750 [Bacillus sp. AFS031507]
MNFWKEAEWSEMLFSYLTAGWYDWTVSEHLYKNNTHCLSVTAGYYSHYILTGALLQLYLADEEGYRDTDTVRDISESHAKLCNFLRGRLEPDLRKKFVEFLEKVTGQQTTFYDKKLLQIGDALYNAKKARESHTYHVLVVPHQTLAKVTSNRGQTINVSKTVEDINGYILELSAIINKFVLDLVLKVLMNLDESIKHYHLKHFIEEIEDYHLLVKKENVGPGPSELLRSLEQVRFEIEMELDERKVLDYRRFKETISSFGDKWRSYNNLNRNLSNLEDTLSILSSDQ